jgi:hypothetical protein
VVTVFFAHPTPVAAAVVALVRLVPLAQQMEPAVTAGLV